MEFSNKYSTKEGDVFITADREGKVIEIPKIAISTDAFAIGEVIEDLKANIRQTIEKVRLSLIK